MKKRTAVALIPLSCGFLARVDASDFQSLALHKWYQATKRAKYRSYHYAARNDRLPDGRPVTIFMHRQILALAPGDRRDVDHKDGDGLNNTRANLRIASRSLHSGNKRRQANKRTSRFKGVYPNPGGGFRAQIKHRVLGRFQHEEDAALAYNRAAAREFGHFAQPNETGDWATVAPELLSTETPP